MFHVPDTFTHAVKIVFLLNLLALAQGRDNDYMREIVNEELDSILGGAAIIFDLESKVESDV